MIAKKARPLIAILRTLVLTLVAVSASSNWVAPIAGSHCDLDAAAAHNSAIHSDQAAEHRGAPSWTPGTQHECSHCASQDCSRTASCATPGSVALAQVDLPAPDLSPRRIRLVPLRQHFGSNRTQPLTPPPQPAA